MTHMGDKSGTLSPNQIPDIVWQINDWIWLVYWMSMLPIECVTPVSLQWWLFTLPIIIMIQFVSIWLTTFTQIFLLRIKRLRLNTTNYEEQFHSQIRVTFHQQKKSNVASGISYVNVQIFLFLGALHEEKSPI